MKSAPCAPSWPATAAAPSPATRCTSMLASTSWAELPMRLLSNPAGNTRPRLSALPLALAGALLLGACAHTPEPLALPAAPVAGVYAEASSPTDPAAPTLAWRSYFTDPALQALITQALANNRDLRIAAARVQQSQAAWGLQHAASLPSVVGMAGNSRVHLPAGINPLGSTIQASGASLGLGFVSWEVDLWNRLGQLQDAAAQSAEAAEQARRGAELSLVAQVAQAYLALGELDERLALARQAEASRAESLRIFTRRVAMGASSRLQLTQVQTLLTQAQALVVQLEQTRAAQAQTLIALVGTPLELPERADALSRQSPVARLRTGLPSELLQARPDIVAAEHQLRAAHAQVGAARAAFYPSLTLTTALGTTSSDFDGLFRGASKAWLFAPSLNLQQARQVEAVAQYEKSIQNAFREVNDALSASHALEQQVRIAEAALQAQTERARLSERRFDAGSAAFLEVLDAQRDLLSAGQQLVQARRAAMASRVLLYAALGGGTLAAADANPGPTSSAPSSAPQTATAQP